jgi:G3E family GTPase
MTDIYLISGFLGAGKTTLIQKLLSEAFAHCRVALIENDFGEISVDAALLKTSGVEVRELNSGCICCSLYGDFVRAIGQLIERFQPEIVLIEPSGVAKLSDVAKACGDPRLQDIARLKAKIVVADVRRCRAYLANFGEFYADQIDHADIIVLSRSGEYPERVAEAEALIRGRNSQARIFSAPWSELDSGAILAAAESAEGAEAATAADHHAAAHEHHHHHTADEVFTSITLRSSRVFREPELRAGFERLSQLGGTVLRAKGIVAGPDGYLNVQYTPDELKISACDTPGGLLNFIGSGLKRQELQRLFELE